MRGDDASPQGVEKMKKTKVLTVMKMIEKAAILAGLAVEVQESTLSEALYVALIDSAGDTVTMRIAGHGHTSWAYTGPDHAEADYEIRVDKNADRKSIISEAFAKLGKVAKFSESRQNRADARVLADYKFCVGYGFVGTFEEYHAVRCKDA